MTLAALRKVLCAAVLVLLPSAWCLAQQAAATAPAPSEAAMIQALANEIRELRLSLERSQLLTLRFQAVMQANQLHADRLKELTSQLTLVRAQLAGMAAQQAGAADEIRRLTETSLRSADREARAEAEERLPRMKMELQQLGTQAGELSGRESQLVADIQRETVQMDDARRWLQQFEQAMQPAR